MIALLNCARGTDLQKRHQRQSTHSKTGLL